LSEQEFRALPIEEQLSTYKDASVYIDHPAYMSEVIVENPDAIYLIIEYLGGPYTNSEKHRMASLLFDYYTEKGVPREAIPILEAEEDPELRESYNILLERFKESPFIMVSPGKGDILPFTTNNAQAIAYINKMKDSMQTLTEEPIDEKVSFVGYTMGKEQEGSIPDYPRENIFNAGFIVHMGWLDISDSMAFEYMQEGKRLTADEAESLMTPPDYLNKDILPKQQVLGILKSAGLESDLEFPDYEHSTGTTLNVYGTIDEKNNKCIAGTIDLTNGAIEASAIPCYDHVDCCTQCIDAFTQSPDAIGPEVAQCGKFNSANQIGELCLEEFKSKPQTVEECR